MEVMSLAVAIKLVSSQLFCFLGFQNKGFLLFILPFSHVSWQPPNIYRSSSDFFYPKSLIRRTGRTPSLQVGAVSGRSWEPLPWA